MIDFNGFKGAARKLTMDDLEAIADSAGIELAALRAVVAVEAAGSGFDSDGRPKILYEPHIFWRLLDEEDRQDAMDEELAYPKWGMKPYPKGSDAQYERLTDAMEYDQSAALQSCSWGMGQVMGGNYKVAGYANVESMVLACMESEANQVEMMVNFIKGNRLLAALQSHDWAAFAKGYNGPGYAKNAYDVKLAEAYERFSG
jgi:hypothetical protein